VQNGKRKTLHMKRKKKKKALPNPGISIWDMTEVN